MSDQNPNANEGNDEQIASVREALAFHVPLRVSMSTETETEEEFTARLRREYNDQRRDARDMAETQAGYHLSEGDSQEGTPENDVESRPERSVDSAAIHLLQIIREMDRLSYVQSHVRDAAARDAAQAPMRRDEEIVKQILGEKLKIPIEQVREELRKARKPTMKTKEHFLCDSCREIITKPAEGFVIQGNVYVADPTMLGGLVGNNIPNADENGNVRANAIKKTVLCTKCLLQTLGLDKPSKKKPMKGRSAFAAVEPLGATESMIDYVLAGLRAGSSSRPSVRSDAMPVAEARQSIRGSLAAAYAEEARPETTQSQPTGGDDPDLDRLLGGSQARYNQRH